MISMKDTLDQALEQNRINFDHTQHQHIDPSLPWLYKHPLKKIDHSRLDSSQMAKSIQAASTTAPEDLVLPSGRRQYPVHQKSTREEDSLVAFINGTNTGVESA